ncbi:MAG: hypothetical protein J6S58_10030, partial [Lentisphaeria bacterium]|nr:hypothetical protein [Lentisphaeria bacterium]
RGGIFVCPASPGDPKKFQYIGFIHYGMPGNMYQDPSVGDDRLPLRISRVRTPSARALLMDTYYSSDSTHWPQPVLNENRSPSTYGYFIFQSWGAGLERRRHKNSSNGAFLDGHVENVKNHTLQNHGNLRSGKEPNMLWYIN